MNAQHNQRSWPIPHTVSRQHERCLSHSMTHHSKQQDSCYLHMFPLGRPTASGGWGGDGSTAQCRCGHPQGETAGGTKTLLNGAGVTFLIGPDKPK